MRAGQEPLPHCCGVLDLGNWQVRNEMYSWDNVYRYSEIERSGTGLFTTTFVNEPSNKEAYEQLCREHKLLYQSPVKLNQNSGNRLFLCVFQWKSPRSRNRRGERLPNL